MKNLFSRATRVAPYGTAKSCRPVVTGITAVIIGLVTSAAALAGNKHHDNRQVYRDYGKVVHVEPIYRTVTKRVPHRTCHVPRGHSNRHNNGHHNGHRNNHYRSDLNQQRSRPRPEAVFIGGVIGGAIGHELTKSINGRSSTGATLAGAAIGAGLVAGHQNYNNHGGNRQRISSNHYRHKHRHQKHNKHRQQRCTTTEHVQHVRELSGYQVTYRYHGRTFQTHTDHHPGAKIPVRVAISTR